MRGNCSHASSGPSPLIDRAPVNPLDPIANRDAVAHSEGQGRRRIFRTASTCSWVARPENPGRRRSLALDRSEHDGRVSAVRDGGACPAVPAIVARLVAGLLVAALPDVALADPPTQHPILARTTIERTDPLAAYVSEAAKRFAIPERWIRAVMRFESAGDRHAVSPKGAMGLMQIMPATWAELRARYRLGDDPFNARDNILAGAAYLAEVHDLYGSPGFLAAYNAGPRRYERHLVSGNPLPAETVDYLAKIVPLIDTKAAIVVQSADHSAHSRWAKSSLFFTRTAVENGDGIPADGKPSDRSSDRHRVVDLSALAASSDGLFVRRDQAREPQP
ncbi:lytic transglycosylase domain-containing protein [Rhizobium leguminosarum]|uniref:lytic transglycosylase domain-containing protein n=1 Tax=Rhizobium leguminosarum TaxID=384 RepID=UPI0024A941C9|nr:lytic transglycosylase domain-containing protein [Rhizobium leguminosarum]MDI5927773.1 lytic transglycosylase domain-containing protein [Rhizobium leguminosarum]